MKNANPVFRGALTLALATVVVACSRNEGAGRTRAETGAVRKTVADYFPTKVGDQPIRIQLAVHPGEMQQGLMGRRDLGRHDGMLFVYDKPQQMGFWMRNTPTPLDIGYFTPEGVLEEIHPLHPFDENTVTSRSEQLQFALEMNQGWFVENGVKPGARLDLKAVAAAMKERGFQPRKFGLPE